MNEYYLLRQTLFKNIKQSTIIPTPTNEIHIKKFVEAMDGTVDVFLVDTKTNKKTNLTHKLGKTVFEDKEEITKNIQERKYARKYWITYKEPRGIEVDKIYIFSEKDIEKRIPNPFFIAGAVTFVKCWGTINISLEDEEKNKIKGSEYEKFIGKKYEEAGYSVEYSGIEREKQDGGIDLIAKKDEIITLIQCKNWIATDYNKITAKDLRAFMGDCYLYLIENEGKKSAALHFIISDENMLNESARYYLKRNKHIKLKAINFDKE